ncbi:HFL208Cp [Eremothecium sinecaudum]|uniref:Large ribosomal subunit protein bL33m n=1 Tax=Eremothecium sinecaudum TaxID=45286 RepID=A0A109V0B6_9SACH|nr:HFL208Cp [Eremothecium sinecaudum]AMD21648.1 HFL208Cp [Eremothecium sinecaudum]
MAKAKSRNTVIKLVSTALTGVCRHILVPRGSPIVTQVRYDRVAKRHVLFKEAKKRKIADPTSKSG